MMRALTVLLVEDNEDEAALLTRALCRSGVTNSIRVVRDGEEAIRYLQGQGEYANRILFPIPDIIFTDLKMAGLGGMEVLRWLKAHPNFFVIPVVVLSGCEMDAEIQMAYALGANAYMVKPPDMGGLEQTLGDALKYWVTCKTPRPVRGA